MRLFLLLAALQLPALLIAQKLHWGVQVSGAFLSSAHVQYVQQYFREPGYTALLGYQVNGYIAIDLTEKKRLSLEPGWTLKGYEIRFPGPYNSHRHRLDYLQLPVLFNFQFLNRFTLDAGAEFALRMNTRIHTAGATAPVTYNYTTDNRYDMGGLLGFTYFITSSLHVGARFGQSFLPALTMNIIDNDGNVVGENRLFNRYIQLFVRYQIE